MGDPKVIGICIVVIIIGCLVIRSIWKNAGRRK